MSTLSRRSAGRRRAWGRGPIILKFEPLEQREVLSTIGQGLPDLAASSFVITPNADWNDPITAIGTISNHGFGTAESSFRVDIYASHNNNIGPYAVKIGEVTIPSGLAPGESAPFTTTVRLPANPIPGVPTNGVVHINLKVDPQNAVQEYNKRNNSGPGNPHDQANVQITVARPANLISTAVGIFPTDAQWGGTLSLTSQVKNSAQGDAPASRAQVVLTPVGINPGGPSDVTIGSISIPAIKAWQTVNVEGHILLPVTPPLPLTGSSQFVVSILPDADYLTNVTYPHFPIGGLGIDQVLVNITVPPGTTPPPLGPLPDLAAGSVTTSAIQLTWGASFQAQATVQNMGLADPGAFRVRFLLVGQNGDTSHAIFLGDAHLSGLQPGSSQQIDQNLALPARLPSNLQLSSIGYARIAVIIDPENTLNETFKNNNVSTSSPITLRVMGTDGTSFVPNLPSPEQLPPAKTAVKSTPKPQNAARNGKRVYRRPPPPKNDFVHKLSVFPKQVYDNIKKWI